jgi:Quinohemoprotein amine dehydrogenase, alpha subunit domain III
MTPLRLVVLLAVTVAALFAGTAEAYEHLGEVVGSDVLSQHWRALPIALTVDNGPTNVLPEISTAAATWNAVPTAKDPWGTVTLASEDFTLANMGTSWGNLDGDGKQEVVVDETGSIFRSLGIAPASANGFGVGAGVIDRGEAVINDMYLLLNGTRTNFDRRATEVHELGHTVGLAHSSVGWPIGKDGALAHQLEAAVPTMHPFSISTNDRQSLEADDEASLSELYPQPSFHTTTGTITGVVTRCGSGEPVLGANVRAINVADPTIQLSRYTGFDGKTDGSYEINGVPPGDYDVVVEPLAGDTFYLDRLTTFTRIDADFTQEFLNKSKEGDCAQDTDPDEHESIPVGASGTVPADFKVEGSSLALVIDVTGSMGPEIGDIKTGLNTMISGLEALGAQFPKTAIVTFDDRATIRTVSRDPERLRTVINGLTTHSTPDCPEGANAALMTAGRLLGSGGRAILVTDADSHPTGPRREAVEAMYRAKGARLSVLLSGSCPPPPASAARVNAAAAPDFGGIVDAPGPDEAKPADVLGVEGSVRTFSEESLFSGGLFAFQPEVKTGTADVHTRYANTLANVGISSVTPAVAALSPSAVPQGSSLTVELTGSNTGFRSGSAVSVGGAGVSVDSVDVLGPTRLAVRLSAAAGAVTGFRDVTVTTPRGDGTTETARGIGAVQVVGAPSAPTVLSVVPATVAAGETRDVAISGALTHFGAASVASLGAGVTVNRLTAQSPTRAVANVTVAAGAAVGFRDVAVQSGGELATESVPGPFLVTAAPPAIARLVAASPVAAVRGTTVDVALTGADTAFEAGRSVASVSGSAVQVLSTTVTSPTAAVARLRIADGAPLGFRDLKVSTGAEEAALLDGFEVLPAGVQAPPAPPAPGTPPASPACTDRTPPNASLRSVTVRRGRLRLSGRASDAGCGAAVARVEVSISRAAGRRRCRFVDARGRLTRARSCARPVRLRAAGRASWSFATKRTLPRGTYAIQARAVDAAGNVQTRPAKRTRRVR